MFGYGVVWTSNWNNRIGNELMKIYCFIIVLFVALFFGIFYEFKSKYGVTIQDAHLVLQNIGTTGEYLKRSYFPTEAIVIENDAFIGHLGNEFDPRLILGLYLRKFYYHLKIDKEFDFRFDFSWHMFIDTKRTSYYSNHLDLIRKFEDSNFDNLNVNFNHSYLPLEFLGPIDDGYPEEIRSIAGLSYLLGSAPTPEKIIFLGLGLSKGLVIPFKESQESQEPHQILHNLINDFNLLNDIPSPYLKIVDEVSLLSEYLYSVGETDGNLNKYKLISTRKNISENNFLNKDDFLSNNSEIFPYYNRYNNEIIDQDINLKYFHEAIVLGSDKGSHYDWRFFNKLKYSTYERQSILHRLTRAWLKFSESANIQTWLAHGSLLGWYWNGLNLPWDGDVDVQITMSSLLDLTTNYNQSIVVDFDEKDLNIGTGSYLIDVSSNIFDRHSGNGLNNIDARFIDISSGMYVDITALSYSEISDTSGLTYKKAKEFNQMLDSEFRLKENSNTLDKEELKRDLQSTKESLIKNRTLLNCKDNHFYRLEELTPLKRTMFEGHSAYVPNNFKMLLKREYSHGLYSTRHEGYTFRPMLDIWVPSSICRNDAIGNTCSDESTLLETHYTKPITTKHRLQNQPKFSPSDSWFQPIDSIRIDPWINSRNKKIMQIMHYNKICTSNL